MLRQLTIKIFSVALLIACNPIDREIEAFDLIPYITLEKWDRRQGGAIYEDKLVCLNAVDKGGTPNGFIYDIKTGLKICEMTFTSNLGQKNYYRPHANQVSFGCDFYNAESDFPLLYVTQANGGNGYNDIHGERGVLVYNLRKVGYNDYVPDLVQAIIPDIADTTLMAKLGKYTPNYIINNDNAQFIVIGYPNNSWYDLTGDQPITIFNIPTLDSGSEVILTSNDIIDAFTLSKAVGPQQSFYYKGKVYSSGGDRGHASFRVINLRKKKEEYFKDMTSLTNGEPQFIGLWNSKVLYYEYDTTGLVYEIKISGYHFE